MAFSFTKVLTDIISFPTKPGSNALARKQFQDMFDEVANYLNTYVALKAQPAWIAPTLLNGWVNFGSGIANVGYYKDELGIVRLRGVIKGGTMTAGTGLLVLPIGYRPIESAMVPCVSNNSTIDILSHLVLNSSGLINIGASVGNGWLSLDGITFRAEQ